jgi:hypothetical protein
LQELLRESLDVEASSTTDADYDALKVKAIVAGAGADADTAKRRMEATSKLLAVAGTPRGQHLSAQTPRDVLHAEMALQEFIQAHGGGAEGLDALQHLMAAAFDRSADATGNVGSSGGGPARPAPRDPTATLSEPPPPARHNSYDPAYDKPIDYSGIRQKSQGLDNRQAGGGKQNGDFSVKQPKSLDFSSPQSLSSSKSHIVSSSKHGNKSSSTPPRSVSRPGVKRSSYRY